MYHVYVHSLAERVLDHIRQNELLSAGDRIGIAVSGGIDSVALLRLLLELRGELGIVLSVVHFNHKLRGVESEADQEFVANLARGFDLEFYCDWEETARFAAEEHSSLEVAARELRYGFFRHLLGTDGGEVSTSQTKAHVEDEVHRSAESAALFQIGPPQGLKPVPLLTADGTTEVVPFPSPSVKEVILLPNPAAISHLDQPTLGKICTGHTLDDQAETVLMRVIRGTGLKGLGAIHPRLLVENEEGEFLGEIVRPLLRIRRVELEKYLRELRQSWREDASNTDNKFTRNRVRRTLLPLLEKEFNPSVAETLAELAEIARGEEDYWENEAAGWLGRTVQWSEPEWMPQEAKSLPQRSTGDFTEEHGDLVQIQPASFDSSLISRVESAAWLVMNGSVDRLWLLGEPLAVQRRVITYMGEYAGLRLEFKHVEEILRFAAEDDGEPGQELSLPLGWKVLRHAEELVFLTPNLRQRDPDSAQNQNDYEYELPLPGMVLAPEARASFETQFVSRQPEGARDQADYYLDAASLPGPLRLRNWRAGDRFWPSHTKAPKKIKELLQGRASGRVERKLWPVILSGDEIVWVRGFPIPKKFQAKPGQEAVLITERIFGGPQK